MASCQALKQARNRGLGQFEHLIIHLECYNATGRHLGACPKAYMIAKSRAKDQFRLAFDEFRANLRSIRWDYRVSFEFGDDKE